jgi:hypothetical protein
MAERLQHPFQRGSGIGLRNYEGYSAHDQEFFESSSMRQRRGVLFPRDDAFLAAGLLAWIC